MATRLLKALPLIQHRVKAIEGPFYHGLKKPEALGQKATCRFMGSYRPVYK